MTNKKFEFKIPEDVELSVNATTVKSTYEIEALALTSNLIPLIEKTSIKAVIWIYISEDGRLVKK